MEETPAQLTYNDYTAGWVAVLPCEIDAARLLLDHEHKRLDSTRGDANNYILGDVDGHNIAITYPGFGIKGETAETHVASNMLRTFEKIRFGLLVGVAGGAPGSRDPEDPRKDIRLGDVVVSCPVDGYGEFSFDQCPIYLRL
ncbi:kinesin [Dactylonectria macrodidyma]|uniref:Kinesin n=1 Tax=Dactylonectria macrodidyma TaxID=307937 RepID=A0A9P9IKV3_9HYPO|nr:kinesin [Dactylonectria macrodidyma]